MRSPNNKLKYSRFISILAAHRYGSLNELLKAGLIDSDLSDRNTFRHTFELTNEVTGYELLVYPDESESRIVDAEYSPYMDDSGLIRMSFKAVVGGSSGPNSNQ